MESTVESVAWNAVSIANNASVGNAELFWIASTSVLIVIALLVSATNDASGYRKRNKLDK